MTNARENSQCIRNPFNSGRIGACITNPTITIGLTFYNSADTLWDALKSIFAQTFEDWELIIIDDQSTDGSYEIAASIKDHRVKVYRQDRRLGFVSALNRMAGLAVGAYYARMDSDDMMHPDRLTRQLEFLRVHPNVDVVDTAMYSMDRACRPTGVRGMGLLDPRPAVLLRGGFLHHATVMGRTEWFRKNPYDPAFIRAEDCELWCRTFTASQYARLSEPLYFVREGLVSVDNYLKSLETIRRIIRTRGPKLTGKWRMAQLIGESYAKGLIYRVLGSFNRHDLLVNMRNRTITNYEKERVRSIIESIQSTHVPGFRI
ncbi:MAG TPA: glycosyltransferase family 2 protein [Syntrophorhabdaceae bacterium]|nr:glycosyltransferase family 2 protein [Syntrophorhabdaceae bacterium]